MKVSLIGFMGSGKSTVGKLLAQRLDLKFLETDNIIEKKEGKSINEIFSSAGEKYFRRLEEKVLEDIVHKHKDFVLSTGGGIVLSKKNRKLLKKSTFPVFLETSAEEIYKRTINDNNRPLLKTDDPLKTINKLLQERKSNYYQFSCIINTDNKNPEQIVHEIINIMGVE